MGLLARSKGAPAVILSNLQGDNVAIAPPLPDLIGQNFAFRDWFKGAQQTGKPYVSSAYRSVAPGNPLVVGVSTPVFRGNTRVGYLTILGQLEQVRAVAEGARQDDGVVIAVTDQSGQPLTAALPVDRAWRADRHDHRRGHRRRPSTARASTSSASTTSPPLPASPGSAGPSPRRCRQRSRWRRRTPSARAWR